MSSQVLVTKLFIPATRPELVPRPRLIERLNDCTDCKLTLVSAPAGFGKTTLVAEWLQIISNDSQSHFAWLSLDEGDNDPARFLTYFIAALNQIDDLDKLGEGSLSMLQAPQTPPTETILTSLINEIANIPGSVIFVLDDYHLIEAQAVHEALGFLLENMPPQMHLVIATREDPLLPLSRLRARGQLTELRATDLRFANSEAAEFLNQMMGLNLSTDDITALETRTEGWIAGLQLAAISLRGQTDTSKLIQSFTGSNRLVLDYLIEEVLDQQPREIQNFLLRTSILERLNGSLCDALTGRDNGQQVLETLERANLFIVPLDNERRWYRYHHLFADLLRQRQNQTQAENIPALHIRASEWFNKEGANQEAIKHSLAAQDYERAIELIESIGVDILQRGNHSSVSGWINEIPEEIIIKHPCLCVLHAWVLQLTGEVEPAATRLTTAEHTLSNRHELKESDFNKAIGLLNYRRASSSIFSDKFEEAIAYAKKALDHLPESAILIRVHTVLYLGIAHRNLGQLQEALDIYNSILHSTEQLDGTSVAVYLYTHLSDLYWEMAQLQRAKDLCEQALSLTEQKTGRPDMPYCGLVYTRIGRILRQWNQLEDSLEFTMKGHALCLDWNVVETLAINSIEVAYINLAMGNDEQAFASIDEVIRIYDNFYPAAKKNAAALKAEMELSRGDIEYAERIVQTNDSFVEETFQFQREIEYITQSRLLIAQKKFDEAKVFINRIYQHAQEAGIKLIELKCLILFSKLFYKEGDVDQALEHLYKAIAIAEPEGYIRIFVDEGPPMARLLYEALSHEIAPDYVQQLLRAFPVEEPEKAGSPQPKGPDSKLIEPLSEREIEVLQLIAEGISNQEISSRLFLSVNTVKTHTRNIYGKLGVNARTQAAARARALGLLSPSS